MRTVHLRARVAEATLLFRDLAVVLVAAGAVALLFHQLRQPVILGYLLAGFVVGPYSWGPSFVTDAGVMGLLGELGIVFLLFALGLEFSLGKLRKVGATAIVAGTIEIAIMLLLGYGIGRALGWGPLAATFLGAVMSISSTTIIVKVLAERGQKDEDWAQTAFGILIIEDILAVLLLTALSSAGATGNFQPEQIGGLLTNVAVFLGAAVVLGLLLAPRLVDRIAALDVEEVMVMVAVGIGFGMALLASSLGFSAGLGAFIAGALMAESPRVARIIPKIEPLRDVFTAIFFVTVGAALVPGILLTSWKAILLVTLGVLAGKMLAITLATFIAGERPGKALRVGMTMAQIGEFAFIIAALGATLGVVPPSLYPIVIAVCALTAFATPYLVRASPHVVRRLGDRVPVGLRAYATTYGSWVRRLGRSDRRDPEWKSVHANAIRLFLVTAVVVALVVLGGLAGDALVAYTGLPIAWGFFNLQWVVVTLAAAPFLLVGYAAIRNLVVSLARLAVPIRLRRAECTSTERILRRTFGLGATLLVGGFCVAILGLFVDSVLYVLIPALGAVLVSTAFLGRSLGRFHEEVERTIARVTDGSAAPSDDQREDAMRRLEAAHAWGAQSREIILPQVSGAGGRTLGQLRLRELTGASVILIRRAPAGGAEKSLEPLPHSQFEAGDRILLVGEDAALTRAEEILLGRDLGVSGGATEFRVGRASPLVGRTLAQADLPADVQVLLVRRAGVPQAAGPAQVLQAGDVVVVAGPELEVEKVGQMAESGPE